MVEPIPVISKEKWTRALAEAGSRNYYHLEEAVRSCCACRYPALELTRLTVPRRVYTQAHMDVVPESVKAAYNASEKTRGLVMVYERKHLRFFQTRFERIA